MHPGSVNAREGRQFRCNQRERGLGILRPVALCFLVALLALPTIAMAQGVGAVNGTIRNGETGERLDYANVVLTRNSDGAVWGAMSLDA